MMGDIAEMKDRQTRMEDRQSRMEADISEIKLELKSIRKELTELRSQLYHKADIERFNSLEERVARIEKALQLRQKRLSRSTKQQQQPTSLLSSLL